VLSLATLPSTKLIPSLLITAECAGSARDGVNLNKLRPDLFVPDMTYNVFGGTLDPTLYWARTQDLLRDSAVYAIPPQPPANKADAFNCLTSVAGISA